MLTLVVVSTIADAGNLYMFFNVKEYACDYGYTKKNHGHIQIFSKLGDIPIY